MARGYAESMVDLQIQRASLLSREVALQPHPRERTLSRIPLVVTYFPGLNRLSKIVRKHLPILHVSEKLKQAVPNPPLVAYRRPYNLRDLLVRAAVQRPAPPTTSGNVPCNCKRCKTCQLINCADTFSSNTTGRGYKVKYNFKCKTKNMVYLISCCRCGVQYVRETENALHIRMNGHRSDVTTTKLEKPVAAHFNLQDHSLDDLKVMGIEKIWNNDTDRRKLRERFWILELRTFTPEGLNLDN